MDRNHEELLLALALSKSAGLRAAFLERECGDDAALRQRLETRLGLHPKPAEPAAGDATQVTPTIKLALDEAPDEAVGQTLGRYKLLERIGEGGCGVVYVAEQSQPVRRRVALKVIKLGMDTKMVVARFEAERQALAMMDHPNIARVLDAGSTEVGRPFFVMELVRGIRITDYCDQNNLSTRDRLDLFIKVCQAIQHAHQKGIIHRDIKPSNILVTLHDGVPVPKVIDFGIAKAVEGRLTDATVYTQLHHFIGTPAYMSPEQAEMSGLDIDTRSDIYSLGVLLYELLAGSTPFDGHELMSQGIDHMRKTIRERDPVRPSTRFATMSGEDLTTTARRRSADTSKLMHELKGDLDWIVMKCLEKDRTRRYETANGLAADLKRHLNNEPVIARPPSTLYRLQKAIRRNKLAFTAGAAVATALLLGIVASSWQSIRAVHARREAEAAQASETVQRRKAESSEQQALAAQANEARLRQQAEAAELAARQRAYGSDMNVASQALGENNLGRALMLLNRQRPSPGQKDLRGWEWRYLWQQTRSDARTTLWQNPSEIKSLACSADGQWLAIGGLGKDGLTLWDLAARQVSIRLAQNEEDVHLAFSPSAPLLAYVSGLQQGNGDINYGLHVWDARSRRGIADIDLQADGCAGLAMAADGQTLVTSTFSGITNYLTLWRMPTGQKLATFPTSGTIFGPMATSFATTPDLSMAAFGTLDYGFQVLDLHTGRTLWGAPPRSGFYMALAFSPDGKTLATAEGFNESDIRLWDVASGKQTGRLIGHGAWVNSLAFWPDGKTLASSSADQTIRTWDLASLTTLEVLRGHRFGVWRVALLPDGKTLVSGCKDGTVCLWDTHPSQRRQPVTTVPVKVSNWCFAPDSLSVITLDFHGQVSRWTVDGLPASEPIMDLGTNFDLVFYNNSQFSQDGTLLANGSLNGTIRVWDLVHHTLLRQFTNTSDIVVPIKFQAGGSQLLTASKVGYEIHLWDLTEGRELQNWPSIHADDTLADSRDEHQCLEVEKNGKLYFRNLQNRTLAETNLDFKGVYNAAYSSNGKRFAVASTYGYARVWDTTAWREVATLNGFLSGVSSVVFSPDDLRLATGSGKQQALSLWDTTSWQNVFTLAAQGAGFFSTDFSQDGNAIASLNADRNLQIWHAPSWAEIEQAEAREKAPVP